MKKTILVILAIVGLAIIGCTKNEEPKKAEAPQVAVPAQQQQQPPVAGVETLGIMIDQVSVVANGWSVKKQILGHDVFNDKGEKVGNIYDLIISPDKAVSYAIIAAGGFLGMDKQDVAIPANQLKIANGKLTLPGATKDAIKAMPSFVYTK